MKIEEAKSYIQAGFSFANWTNDQKSAFKVAWECMTKCQQKEMGTEGLTKLLREHHQLIVYSAEYAWGIKLFDLNADPFANDAACLYQDKNRELDALLVEALEWVARNQELY